jgi:hypothetical protein
MSVLASSLDLQRRRPRIYMLEIWLLFQRGGGAIAAAGCELSLMRAVRREQGGEVA